MVTTATKPTFKVKAKVRYKSIHGTTEADGVITAIDQTAKGAWYTVKLADGKVARSRAANLTLLG